jgi:hypothetical protein
MIELIWILRTVKGDRPQSIRFEDLEWLLFKLWEQDRIAIYGTSLALDEELQKLADLGAIQYDGKTIIVDPNTFKQKTELIVRVAQWMLAGNAYLKYVRDRIVQRAEELLAERIARADAQAAV